MDQQWINNGLRIITNRKEEIQLTEWADHVLRTMPHSDTISGAAENNDESVFQKVQICFPKFQPG